MKKIFTLIAAALMSASMFAQPATVPCVRDLEDAGYDVTSARVICLYFDEQVYYDIVWAGSYNGWSIDNPASMIHFKPLEGFAGWYVAEVDDARTPQADQKISTGDNCCVGKPVQLKKDGSFSWDFQSGDAEAWINMAQPGTKQHYIYGGQPDEADICWNEYGAYIYEVAYFKNHNTPYGAPDDPVLATLDSLVIKGKATKMEYEVGEAFDPAGLEVWGIYTKTVKHDSISQIKSGITWDLMPETFGDDDVSDNASVTMVASFNELTTADTTITGIKVNAVVPASAPYLMIGKTLTINDLKASEKVNMQYFKYENDERINGIAGDSPNSTINLFDTIGYCEINYTNKDDVKRNFIVNPKIENAVDSIYQGETYLFADTLLTTAGTYQRTIESNTMTLTLKVKQKPVKYTTYENWQIKHEGSEWKNMTKVEEGLFKLEILWEGTGFNVKSDDNPIKKDWYDVDDPDVVKGEEALPPATLDVYLRVIDDETLKIGIGVEPPAPASGPTVDETGITVNGRKYGFPVRLVKEVK